MGRIAQPPHPAQLDRIVARRPRCAVHDSIMSQTQVATENLVHVSNLVKDYDELRAVDGIEFDVKLGETFGLLGPNGAGKTTTMRMLAGLSPATDGSITVAGMDVAKSGRDVRNVIGVVTQHDGLDNSLVVHRNLEMHGYLAGLSYRDAIKRTKEVLGFFSLESRGQCEHSRVVRRYEAKIGHRARDDGESATVGHGRTDDGSGSAEPQSGMGTARSIERIGRDDHHVNALHDRSRDAMRSLWRSWITATSSTSGSRMRW